jgi:hypothetical protein
MAALTVIKGAFYPGVTQNITTSTSSQASNAVGNTTAIIRISCQQDTYIQITNSNSNVAADANSMIILGGTTEFIAVPMVPPAQSNPPQSTVAPGVAYPAVVAVKQVSASGIVSITQLTGFPTQSGG